jgi:predicted RNA polymerase sigma factor
MLQLEDSEATPFEQLAAQEVQAAVRRALAEVPAIFRSAIILRDLEGLSYEEIAEVLEVSVGTVKSRILRGRRMLKEILDPLLHAPLPEATAAPNRAAGAAPHSREEIRVAAHPATSGMPGGADALAGSHGAAP